MSDQKNSDKVQDIDETPFFPPFERACPFSARELDVQAREHPGLLAVKIWNGTKAWLVGRFDDANTVLTDPRFSMEIRRPGFPHSSAGSFETMAGMFMRTDGEPHLSRRRWLLPDFSVPAAEAMRQQIITLVDERIDALLGMEQPVDLQAEYSLAIPTAAICIILGIPYDDACIYQSAADTIVDQHATREDMIAAVQAINDGMLALARERLSRPRADDLISRLAHDRVATGQMSMDELGRILWLLIVAGHETTANMISLGILAFLQYPDQLRAMQASGNVRAAVEEQMRYWSIVQIDPRRIAVEDVALEGQTVHAGEGVIVSLQAANRDPRYYGKTGDPEIFDVNREKCRHLGFGFGPHACLGQHLARVEMEVAFTQIFERIPALRPAVPAHELRFKHNHNEYGVFELPVTW